MSPEATIHTAQVVDLIPTGGRWNGLLFENPVSGYDAALTWTFEVDLDVTPVDTTEVTSSLTIDWVPAPLAGSWASMVGLEVSCSFGEPAEASVYLGEHHRYRDIRLSVLAQERERLLVDVALAGDEDGLGHAEVAARAWLVFEGIYVQLHPKPETVDMAASALARFTSVAGLDGQDRAHNYLFRPGPT
ncbi:hypothetical protein SAMN05421872_107312 [Nocardioides lianchengensis]|uniref:Uncharacterized protein n=1 Tax=Nocardioides lianchengensis TaxID=1045774 RepID=A0A1G6U517_9ACTN|nr:hypothetical protein SAMN05421872_107312 [Nocardioides lianchengensis]